ncbi:MAG: hypothetical protein OXF89_13350 [Rhodospirillaceae bacterium]|nr:hypothetical protein [Rhodospirillaceae bacterium]MCY4066925.1 hypothetical protein [Rhodospirillaceae bacterium]
MIEMMIEGENQQHVVVAMTPAAALELAQMLRQAVQTSLEKGTG